MLTWWGIMLDVVDTPYRGGVLCLRGGASRPSRSSRFFMCASCTSALASNAAILHSSGFVALSSFNLKES